jgi:ribonuclease HI
LAAHQWKVKLHRSGAGVVFVRAQKGLILFSTERLFKEFNEAEYERLIAGLLVALQGIKVLMIYRDSQLIIRQL